MGPFDISLCMIVRDEEEQLARCLSSVKDIVSEIIIVDTGSTDRSVEIAARYGATILSLPWEADFSAARNYGLQKARGKWILVLDADEELIVPDLSVFPRLLEQPDVYGYFLKFINYVGDHQGKEYFTDAVCRLFRNDPAIRFTGAIHEEVVQSILLLPGAKIEFSELTIRHYGYLSSTIAKKNKGERNTSIILEALKKNPDNYQLQYALGTEYFQKEEYKKALPIFEYLLAKVPVFSGYASDLLLKTVYALQEIGRMEDALMLIEEGLIFYPDFTDLLEMKAIILNQQGKYGEALVILQRAIETGDVSLKYTTSSGSGTYRSCYLAGAVCESLYLWEEAFGYYQRVLAYRTDYISVWHRWPQIALLSGREKEWLDFTTEHKEEIPSVAWSAMRQSALCAHRPDIAEQVWRIESGGKEPEPLLHALLLAQKNNDKEAEVLWSKSMGSSSRQAVCFLYLWALALKRNRSIDSFHYLEKLAIVDPDFASIEGMMKGDGSVIISETACRKCQQALIQVGAWEGFVWFQNQLPVSLSWPWLPVNIAYGLLQFPSAYKENLLRAARERKDQLTYGENLICGLLAYESKNFQSAYDWFHTARHIRPNEIHPLIGLFCLYSLCAEESGHAEGISSSVLSPRFLSLCCF